jgi:flagellar basal body-associated protein FliL
MSNYPLQNVAADLSAGASAILAASTWIAELTAIMQLAATGVAIVAGLAAAWWHIEKARGARRERLKDEDKKAGT